MAIKYNSKDLLKHLLFMTSRKDHQASYKVRYVMDTTMFVKSACLVINPVTGFGYGFLFNCTTVGQTSDSMTNLTLSFISGLVTDVCIWLGS